MGIYQIVENLSVAPQINVEDVTAIKIQGYKSIICNRPDGEELSQPRQSDIHDEAKKQGLEFKYLPISSLEAITKDDIEQFYRNIKELPAPILAYCRTGTRSAVLWSLSQSKQRSTSEILKLTKAAGYDLSGIL